MVSPPLIPPFPSTTHFDTTMSEHLSASTLGSGTPLFLKAALSQMEASVNNKSLKSSAASMLKQIDKNPSLTEDGSRTQLEMLDEEIKAALTGGLVRTAFVGFLTRARAEIKEVLEPPYDRRDRRGSSSASTRLSSGPGPSQQSTNRGFRDVTPRAMSRS